MGIDPMRSLKCSLPPVMVRFNSHFRRLQVLRSKCTGAPWYVSNLKLHADLEVSYLAEYIRNLVQSFDSNMIKTGGIAYKKIRRFLIRRTFYFGNFGAISPTQGMSIHSSINTRVS